MSDPDDPENKLDKCGKLLPYITGVTGGISIYDARKYSVDKAHEYWADYLNQTTVKEKLNLPPNAPYGRSNSTVAGGL
jgi:hypothetical protein